MAAVLGTPTIGHAAPRLAAPHGAAPHRANAPVPADGALSRLMRRLAAALTEYRNYAALSELDDRTLKDIGVYRSDIRSIAHHGPRDPSRRAR